MADLPLKDILLEEGVAVDDAKYDLGLSTAALMDDEQLFFATTDRLMFQSVCDYANKILEAHGYARNLENILAVIETTRVGAKVRFRGRGDPPEIRSYLPGLGSQLPKKGRAGTLLQLFYETVSHYEQEMAELRGKSDKGTTKDAKSTDELKKELKQLKDENDELRHEVAYLNSIVSKMQRSQDHASAALESQNLLPYNYRLATIKSILPHKRAVSVKVGRSSMQVPLIQLARVPREGDPCILRLEGGKVQEAIPIGMAHLGVEHRLGQVLIRRHGSFKLRDSQRQVWELHAVNAQEEETINKLHRGDHLVVTILDQESVVRFVPMRSDYGPELVAHMAEALMTKEILAIWEQMAVQSIAGQGEEEVA